MQCVYVLRYIKVAVDLEAVARGEPWIAPPEGGGVLKRLRMSSTTTAHRAVVSLLETLRAPMSRPGVDL